MKAETVLNPCEIKTISNFCETRTHSAYKNRLLNLELESFFYLEF